MYLNFLPFQMVFSTTDTLFIGLEAGLWLAGRVMKYMLQLSIN